MRARLFLLITLLFLDNVYGAVLPPSVEKAIIQPLPAARSPISRKKSLHNPVMANITMGYSEVFFLDVVYDLIQNLRKLDAIESPRAGESYEHLSSISCAMDQGFLNSLALICLAKIKYDYVANPDIVSRVPISTKVLLREYVLDAFQHSPSSSLIRFFCCLLAMTHSMSEEDEEMYEQLQEADVLYNNFKKDYFDDAMPYEKKTRLIVWIKAIRLLDKEYHVIDKAKKATCELLDYCLDNEEETCKAIKDKIYALTLG